jgi:hypothetical protein
VDLKIQTKQIYRPAGHWFAYVLGPAHPTYHQGNKAKCDARQANPSPKQRSADTT